MAKGTPIKDRHTVAEEPRAAKEEVRITRSSGNVFADLGLENPEELLQKSRLVSVIDSVMKKRRLSQVKAAKMMGISQPDLSKLLRGRTDGFSIERLFTMLLAMGVSTHIRLEVPARFVHRGRIVIDEVQLPASSEQAIQFA